MVTELRQRCPDLEIRPPLGVEIWDPRVDAQRVPRTNRWTVLRCESALANIKVSVIIPTYNNRIYLLNTLLHLVQQDLPRDLFEVIIVDDGSTDDTYKTVRLLFETHSGRFNGSYVYFRRPKPRKMGDGAFRAGVARNLGVKNSYVRSTCVFRFRYHYAA